MIPTTSESNFAARFVKLAAISLVTVGLAMAVGFMPTNRLAGSDGVRAMWVAGGVVLAASWIGNLPLCFGSGSGPQQINRVLGSTALRMFLAVVLTVAVALAEVVVLKPLLLWVAIAYMICLAGETVAIVLMTRSSNTASLDAGLSDAGSSDAGSSDAGSSDTGRLIKTTQAGSAGQAAAKTPEKSDPSEGSAPDR